MSIWNWGSETPVFTRLAHSHTVSHCADAAKPAKNPKKTGMPHIARRRSGSTTSW